MNKREVEKAREFNLIDIVMKQCDKIQKGSNHIKIRCVFHNEKTPSLTIYENNYFCFGCGEHGDIFDWVMKTMDLSFPDAVKFINKL